MSLILTGSTSGETGSISYQWSASDGGVISGSTTESTVTATTAGTYTLVVTDDYNGLTDTETFVVNDLTGDPTLDVDPSSGELTFPGQTLVISASTTTIGNPIYNWTAANGGNIISGGTGSTITINSGGTYTITVIDDYNNCQVTIDVDITSNLVTAPVANITGLTGLTCTATTLTLSGNTSYGDGTIAYQWSSTTETLGTASTQVVISADTYYLYVIDTDNSLTSTTVSTVVTDITSTPVAVITSNGVAALSVSDEFIVLSGSSTGVSGSTLYQWSGDTTGSLGTSPNQTVFVADTYHLTVTDSSNGCTGTTFTGITGSSTLDCSGTVAIILSVSTEISGINPFIELSGDTSTSDNTKIYSWSAATQGVAIGDVSVTAVTTPDTYSLTVTDSINGCTGYTATTITGCETDALAVITGDTVLNCSATTLTIGGQLSTGNSLTYLWSTSNGNITSDTDNPTIELDSAGTYTLTVTDGCNGSQGVTGHTVTSNTIIITASLEALNGLELNATYPTLDLTGIPSPIGNYTHEWYLEDAWLASTQTVTASVPGIYTYIAVDSSGTGCSGTTTEVVTQVTITADTRIVSYDTITCDRPSIILYGNLSSGVDPLSYQCDVSTTAITVADTYELTVTDANLDTDFETKVITKNISSPTATIATNLGTTEIPTGGSLTLIGSGGGTYSWSNGPTTSSIIVSVGGVYTLTVTDPSNGCTDFSAATITVEVPTPTPVARITGDNIINCGTDEDVEDLGNILHIWTNARWDNYSPQSVVNGSGTLLSWDVSGGLDYSEPKEGNPINDPSFNLLANTGSAHIRGYDSIGVTELQLDGGQVTLFDISECPDMKKIRFKSNILQSVDLSQNPDLWYVNLYKNGTLGAGCTKTIDLTNNPELTFLDVHSCRLTNIDFSNNGKLDQIVGIYNCFNDPDMFVTCPLLRDFNLDRNQFVSLNTDNCTGLQVYRVRNQATFISPDISLNPDIWYFGISQTRVPSIDFTNNKKLRLVYLWGNLYLNSYTITNGGSGVGSFGVIQHMWMHTTQISADDMMADLEAYAPNGVTATVGHTPGSPVQTQYMTTGTLIISPDWVVGWASVRTSGSNGDFIALRARGWNIYYYSSGLYYELTTTL
jgi:hypothetical protein